MRAGEPLYGFHCCGGHQINFRLPADFMQLTVFYMAFFFLRIDYAELRDGIPETNLQLLMTAIES